MARGDTSQNRGVSPSKGELQFALTGLIRAHRLELSIPPMKNNFPCLKWINDFTEKITTKFASNNNLMT
jgi:hypothetical protein